MSYINSELQVVNNSDSNTEIDVDDIDNEFSKKKDIRTLKKSRAGYVSYLTKTINTILDFTESIENFDRVKNLEPQLDKTLENIRNITQELCKHLSPEQSQKQHQYFTSHQFRIVNIKKSLNLYYNKCMLKPSDIKTQSLSKIPVKSHRSITPHNSSPSLPLEFETFSRTPKYHNAPFENPNYTNSSCESSSNKSHSSASNFDFDDEYIVSETLNEKQKQSKKATLLVSQAEESYERKIRQLERQN